MGTFLSLYLLSFGLGGLLALCLSSGTMPTPQRLGAAALATVLTCFGGAGVLALFAFAVQGCASLLVAVAFSLPSTALFMALAIWVCRTTARQQALVALAGTLASVNTPIAPGRPGTIITKPHPPLLLVASSPARQPLPVGTTVVIIGPNPKGGSGVEVAPLAPDGTGPA